MNNLFIGATLLSVEEAKQLPDEVLEFAPDSDDILCDTFEDWWLRSPGENPYSDYAAYVNRNGYVIEYGYDVYEGFAYVRPALILNPESSSKFNDGTKLTVGEYSFTIVCGGKYALCDTDIDYSNFRKYETENADDYEVSDVKKIVDKWFDTEIKGKAV